MLKSLAGTGRRECQKTLPAPCEWHEPSAQRRAAWPARTRGRGRGAKYWHDKRSETGEAGPALPFRRSHHLVCSVCVPPCPTALPLQHHHNHERRARGYARLQSAYTHTHTHTHTHTLTHSLTHTSPSFLSFPMAFPCAIIADGCGFSACRTYARRPLPLLPHGNCTSACSTIWTQSLLAPRRPGTSRNSFSRDLSRMEMRAAFLFARRIKTNTIRDRERPERARGRHRRAAWSRHLCVWWWASRMVSYRGMA
jgi:hypothetical protein